MNHFTPAIRDTARHFPEPAPQPHDKGRDWPALLLWLAIGLSIVSIASSAFAVMLSLGGAQ